MSTTTQDLIDALRTGPAVTLVTLEAAERLVQYERENSQMRAKCERLLSALSGLLNIADDSRGVAGYHLNGEIAEWDEFSEIDQACEAAAEATALDGMATMERENDLLRCRKQSEEPAPDSTKVIALTGRYVWLGMSSQLSPANYWRPIGQLPEVEVIESNRMECVTWLPETEL